MISKCFVVVSVLQKLKGSCIFRLSMFRRSFSDPSSQTENSECRSSASSLKNRSVQIREPFRKFGAPIGSSFQNRSKECRGILPPFREERFWCLLRRPSTAFLWPLKISNGHIFAYQSATKKSQLLL